MSGQHRPTRVNPAPGGADPCSGNEQPVRCGVVRAGVMVVLPLFVSVSGWL